MKMTKITTGIASLGLLALAFPALATTKVVTSVISGTVTSMATNQIKVKVGKTTYTTTESSTTTYWDVDGKHVLTADIAVGDHVWVWGVKNTKTHTLTSVSKVKDLSVATGSRTGKLSSIDTTTMVMKIKIGTTSYTSTYSSTTTFWNKAGKASTADKLKVGDQVKVWGQWDSVTHKAFTITKVQDLSR